MGKIKKLKSDLNIVHCERTENGTLVFWADKTFRNIFERWGNEN